MNIFDLVELVTRLKCINFSSATRSQSEDFIHRECFGLDECQRLAIINNVLGHN